MHMIFDVRKKDGLTEQEETRLEGLHEMYSNAISVGVEKEADIIKGEISTLEQELLLTSPPMSETEIIIWRAWLPTAFTDARGYRPHRLEDYSHERIPGPVLKIWERHKLSGLFERFEIWTPQVSEPDPILIGVIGKSLYLLARWGESDANLVSFEDIKRELVRRWYNGEGVYSRSNRENIDRVMLADRVASRALRWLLLSFVCLAFLAFLLNIKWMFGVPIAGILSCGVGRIIGLRLMKNGLRVLARSSALMQSIAKDNTRPRKLLLA